MLVIDGSYGEGGGQVLRTALALAILTGRPMRCEHIRAGRKKPGLRPQHLTAVRAAAAVCDARLEGAELGSLSLSFIPGGPPRPGEYIFDVTEVARSGSAGSVGLVLQTLLLPLALVNGESHLTLRGGTHVPWAPPVSYLEHVFLPHLAQMGVHVRVELMRWGFYPAGGGEIQAWIAGQEEPLRPIVLTERGELERVWGTAAVMNLPAHIPQRMAARARNVLAEAGLQAQVEPCRLRGAGPGAGIFLFAEYAHTTAGFTAYGRRGLPAERVAEAVCGDLLAYHRSNTPADPYLADQLVLPVAMAAGASRVITSQVSQHLLTNVWVVQQLLERELYIEGKPGLPGTLAVEAQSPRPNGGGA
ncbi:MAG: RNA 3'-terminal phosphate cyclase [Chloroflexota bacterium]|nr:RNA 3'-terminal phosphate cyclase [Chloroflexota bacterium]